MSSASGKRYNNISQDAFLLPPPARFLTRRRRLIRFSVVVRTICPPRYKLCNINCKRIRYYLLYIIRHRRRGDDWRRIASIAMVQCIPCAVLQIYKRRKISNKISKLPPNDLTHYNTAGVGGKVNNVTYTKFTHPIYTYRRIM